MNDHLSGEDVTNDPERSLLHRQQVRCRTTETPAQQTRRGDLLPSFSAMLLAFLASQHHTIMMLLFAFGLSGAAMSFMAAVPVVRDVMLGMSLLMIGVIAWQIRDASRPQSMRLMGTISIAATLGLSAWSIGHFGL